MFCKIFQGMMVVLQIQLTIMLNCVFKICNLLDNISITLSMMFIYSHLVHFEALSTYRATAASFLFSMFFKVVCLFHINKLGCRNSHYLKVGEFVEVFFFSQSATSKELNSEHQRIKCAFCFCFAFFLPMWKSRLKQKLDSVITCSITCHHLG